MTPEEEEEIRQMVAWLGWSCRVIITIGALTFGFVIARNLYCSIRGIGPSDYTDCCPRIADYYNRKVQLIRPTLERKYEMYQVFKHAYENYVWVEWHKLLLTTYGASAILLITLFYTLYTKVYCVYRENSHLYDFKRSHVTRINFLRDSIERKLSLIQKNNWTDYNQDAYKTMIQQLKELAETFDYAAFTFKDYYILRDQINEFQRNITEKNLDFQFFAEMDDLKAQFRIFAVFIARRVREEERREKQKQKQLKQKEKKQWKK